MTTALDVCAAGSRFNARGRRLYMAVTSPKKREHNCSGCSCRLPSDVKVEGNAGTGARCGCIGDCAEGAGEEADAAVRACGGGGVDGTMGRDDENGGWMVVNVEGWCLVGADGMDEKVDKTLITFSTKGATSTELERNADDSF